MADTFIWYELMTSDLDAAIDFYTRVVGWTVEDHPNSALTGVRYAILSAEGQGVAGAMQLTDDMTAGGARPTWLGYIHCADVDARAPAIAEAGGTIHVPPMDIPNVGRFALATDPGGAYFYIMAPRPPEGAPPPEALAPTTPGKFSWHELYSSLGDKAAFDFYAGQFGWETMHEMPMGEMGTYRIFGADGVQMGGIMKKPDQVPMSAWGFYTNVEAIDAAVDRVKANGGQVVNGPIEVPGGSWIVQCVDPQGAHFSLTAPGR